MPAAPFWLNISVSSVRLRFASLSLLMVPSSPSDFIVSSSMATPWSRSFLVMFGSESLTSAILSCVPASAPFTPFWASAPMAELVSSRLNPSVLATGAALTSASYSSVTSVAEFEAVLESVSFILDTSFTDSPNMFIVLVTMSAASASPMLLA